MRKRKSNFLEQLRNKQQPTVPEKPISEMTEQELDEELERTKAALRDVKEQELAAVREEQASSGRPLFPRRPRKRPWK
jgi:hypothetical protein